MLTLCDFWGRDGFRFSPYAWRIKLSLSHLKLSYAEIGITFTDKSALAGWTDYQKAPVLKHGDTIVCDSWDIALYLDAHFRSEPPLFEDAGSRRLAAFLNAWVPAALYPQLLPMIAVDVVDHVHPDDRQHYRATREERLGQSLEDAARDREGQRTRFLALLDPVRAALTNAPYLNGAAPGYPDYILAALFLWVRGASPFPILDPEDPLTAWRDRVFAAHSSVIFGTPGYDE